MIDHDRLFKELLTTFFVEFCDLFLPQIARDLERDSVQFLDKEVFTDVTTGARHEADLVARVRWRGQESFFLIHIEHQASKQAEFNRRMFSYFARLLEKHDLPIYPVVIFSYDAPRRAEPENFSITFPDLPVLDFHYRVIQLNRLRWRDYVHNPNPLASALMAKMQIAPQERAKVKLECLRLLVTLKLDAARMQMISGFIDTYLELNREEQAEFVEALQEEPQHRREKVMHIAGNWMKEGLQQGLQQGRREGEANLVLRQLERRVGPVPQTLHKRVAKLPVEKIEALGESLLDFEHLRDLRAWLKENA